MTTAPQFHGRNITYSASKAVEVIGDSLSTIKREDGATWADIGRELGKSDDRAASYGAGLADMPVSAFLRGLKRWNGRLGNAVFAYIGFRLEPIFHEECSDPDKLTRVLRLAHLISAALGDDRTPGVIDDDELDAIQDRDLDEAERSIQAIRARKCRRIQQLREVGA